MPPIIVISRKDNFSAGIPLFKLVGTGSNRGSIRRVLVELLPELLDFGISLSFRSNDVFETKPIEQPIRIKHMPGKDCENIGQTELIEDVRTGHLKSYCAPLKLNIFEIGQVGSIYRRVYRRTHECKKNVLTSEWLAIVPLHSLGDLKCVRQMVRRNLRRPFRQQTVRHRPGLRIIVHQVLINL